MSALASLVEGCPRKPSHAPLTDVSPARRSHFAGQRAVQGRLSATQACSRPTRSAALVEPSFFDLCDARRAFVRRSLCRSCAAGEVQPRPAG